MVAVATFDEVYAKFGQQMSAADQQRSVANQASRKWLWGGLAVTLVLTILSALVAGGLAGVVFVVGLIASAILADRAKKKSAGGGVVDVSPVLSALGEQAGLRFQGSGFEPQGYAAVHHALFHDPQNRYFANSYSGVDENGPVMTYEASLYDETQSGGEYGGTTRTIRFSGEIFTFQRRSAVDGEVLVLPDRGLLKAFKPAKGVQRVQFDDDATFEKQFDVYASNPDAARALLGPELRRRLLEEKGKAKLFARFAGTEALVGIEAPLIQFSEKGKTPVQEKLRSVYDTACGYLERSQRVRTAFA